MNNLALKIASHSILPEPILARRYPRGEQRLMHAVLVDAMDVYQAGPFAPGARGLFSETAAWLADEADPSPFSFRNVCAALHLDPAAVRARLGVPRFESQKQARPRRAFARIVMH